MNPKDRAIMIVRNLPAAQIKDLRCLYCLDSKRCRHCAGTGEGTVKFITRYGGWKLGCGYCKATGVCAVCADEPESD
jgi:hypothetical protein